MFAEADAQDERQLTYISAVHVEIPNSDGDGFSERVQKQNNIIVRKSQPNRIVHVTPNPNELIPIIQKPIFKNTLGRVLDL